MQRQIPRHLVCRAAGMLEVRTLKSNGRILLHAKEGSGTQVGITQYIMSVDAGCVDFSFHPGTGRVLLIDMQMAAHPVEAPLAEALLFDTVIVLSGWYVLSKTHIR